MDLGHLAPECVAEGSGMGELSWCARLWHCARVRNGRAPTVLRSERWTGAITLVIFFGTAAASIGLTAGFGLSVAQTLIAGLLGGGAPAGLYLAWASFRLSAAQAVGPARLSDPAHLADALALAVGAGWRDEAQVRRVYDPYPLPVSWRPADPSLVESWETLVSAAESRPTSPGRRPASWAAQVGELAGAGDDLADRLALIPTGRLIILGGPGSGKTVLMIRLLLDLL